MKLNELVKENTYTHNKILNEFTFNESLTSSYTPRKKLSRVRSSYIDEGVVMLEWQDEMVSNTGRIIYPEFMEYSYFVEGCAKKLLYYLVFHHVDVTTCEFLFNDQIVYEFNCYNDIMLNNSKSHKVKVKGVKSALRKLVNHNIILNIKRGRYMINPMIVGGTTSLDRRRLINVYSDKLREKGKNLDHQFYPLKK